MADSNRIFVESPRVVTQHVSRSRYNKFKEYKKILKVFDWESVHLSKSTSRNTKFLPPSPCFVVYFFVYWSLHKVLQLFIQLGIKFYKYQQRRKWFYSWRLRDEQRVLEQRCRQTVKTSSPILFVSHSSLNQSNGKIQLISLSVHMAKLGTVKCQLFSVSRKLRSVS